ncbi:MAG: succinate dehydrogenase cytochrome b subunit [Myxococcales bacterium]|nr:succinate dehydrogenase cytochrome b subunit [Myxococcales bacterium]
MSWLTRIFTSSVGKKFLAGLTGLGMFLFLIAHVTGNMTLFLKSKVGAEPAFNAYAKKLHELPGFAVGEALVLLAFFVHIVLVIWLSITNRKARGEQGYSEVRSKQPAQSQWALMASKSTLYGGLIILVFLVVHLIDFRMVRFMDGSLATQARVVDALKVPWRAFLYSIASLLVGWHLFHGVQSGFRTMGLRHPRYLTYIQKIGTIAAILIGVLFASMPVAIFIGFIK